MRSLASQFTKFAGVGVIGTAAHYAALIALVQLVGANAVLASSTGAIIGATVNYILNYHYTFRSSKRHHEALTKFFAVAIIGFILNGILMAILTTSFEIYYLFAQIITTGIVLVWNFTGNHIWTFHEAEIGTKQKTTNNKDSHRN